MSLEKIPQELIKLYTEYGFSMWLKQLDDRDPQKLRSQHEMITDKG